MPTAHSAVELLACAKDAVEVQHDVVSGLRFAEEAASLDPSLPEVHLIRARCLARLRRFDEALAALELELKVNPTSSEAAQGRTAMEKAIAQERAAAVAPRQWRSAIPQELMARVEDNTHRYTYRGQPMIKNPFDMALYPLLLWNQKPATLFEIGSFNGASALWFADLLTAFGVDFQIHSVDLAKPTTIEHPRIHFHEGSGCELGKVFPPEMLATCARPFLLIDDADHTFETTTAVLEYFHPHMRKGESMVIEDGMTCEGVRNALSRFLPAHQDTVAVDAFYCDYFGYNATWCPNGFLKRIA